MADLRKLFGKLVAAHRRRCGMTQSQLAEAADLSPTMIVRSENGSSGARFPSIERIAAALGIDPTELFTPGSNRQSRANGTRIEIDTQLAALSDPELKWVHDLLAVALRARA